MARWRVDMIRKRSEHLGTVVAKDEKEAIAVAIKQFGVVPARQNKIVVQKVTTIKAGCGVSNNRKPITNA